MLLHRSRRIFETESNASRLIVRGQEMGDRNESEPMRASLPRTCGMSPHRDRIENLKSLHSSRVLDSGAPPRFIEPRAAPSAISCCRAFGRSTFFVMELYAYE